MFHFRNTLSKTVLKYQDGNICKSSDVNFCKMY